MPDIKLLAAFVIILLLLGNWLALRQPGRKRGRRRLQRLVVGGFPEAATQTSIRLEVELSPTPWLNTILTKIPGMRRLGLFLQRASGRSWVGGFLVFSSCFVALGLLVGWRVNVGVALMNGVTLGLLPLLYVYRKKQQRMRKFEAQLPEALELVARSLRAGHPFALGMQVVGDQLSDPIGAEFARAVNEINYRNDVPEALRHLSQRVDCPDLLFFVTSVIVQREVGGNLAEILEKTGRLIRQRFELQGRVRALAAEGKLSAIILFALPFGIAFMMNLTNPDYYTILFAKPAGQLMVEVVGSMMAIGAFVIKRMIKIRV